MTGALWIVLVLWAMVPTVLLAGWVIVLAVLDGIDRRERRRRAARYLSWRELERLKGRRP